MSDLAAFEIGEHGGAARVGTPVTGGIPFARAAVHDAERLELIDDAGERVPVQTEVLARWDDQSIKWLLLDFFTDLEANATRPFRIRQAEGRTGATPPCVAWRQDGDGVYVDTGCLRARIGPRFLDQVAVRREDGTWLDAAAGPGEMWLTVNGENEGRYSASLDEDAEVAIEQAGPNRLCVRVKGWHVAQDGRRYGAFVLRVHAYAGKPYLRVCHTFIASDLPERGLITGIGLRVRLAMGEVREVAYGGARHAVQGGWPCSLMQADADRQELVHDGNTLIDHEPVDGYLAVRSGEATAACFVRNWRQLHPKKIETNRRGLTVWLWPPSPRACPPWSPSRWPWARSAWCVDRR